LNHFCLNFSRLLLLFFVLGPSNDLVAQVNNRYSNLRFRILEPFQGCQALDSLTIAPPLGKIVDQESGEILPYSLFLISNNQLCLDSLRLRAEFPLCRKIGITYRVLPFDFSAKTMRLDTIAIRKRYNKDAIEFDYSPYEPQKKPWESSGLQSSGAYTRGLSFGNSQNLVFNSNLNLQLDGKLGNDLELRAAISDNSLPIQPDGTTRQLQEFDRIFIQLKRKTNTLTAGDYDLLRPSGYFGNYFKRLQGAMLESKIWLPNDSLRLRAAAAISRGKFSRHIIQGQEGNQGPYRLQGAEGEKYIIVLAGTERVIVDGQLLVRGLEYDYIIDYNLGEVIFTPRKLITKDSRIIFEFEYAVQTYLRSTAALNADWKRGKQKFYFNLYSEQDARNNGGAQELSLSERQGLAQAGDNLRGAYASGIDTLTEFDPNRVLYQLIDTLVCGQIQPMLVYSTNPELARFAARFTEVPAAQGNYILAPTAANGRVFRWSPPDPVTCQPTGNYEPIVRLIAPELKQLWTGGAELNTGKNGLISAEIALSNRDYNRFSPIGNGDNTGLAGYLAWKQGFDLATHWKGELKGQYEYAAAQFQPLNPYRPAEFTRDWNVEANRDTVSEQIGKAGVSLQYKTLGSVKYEFGAFRRQGVYRGEKHAGMAHWKRKGWELQAESNYLKTEGVMEKTRFSRPKADFSKTFFKKDSTGQQAVFKAGIYVEQEKNARNNNSADTLTRASFWYDLVRLYFLAPENNGRWQLGGFVSQRKDYAPAGNLFKKSTEANELNLNGAWKKTDLKTNNAQSLAWVLTLRRLKISDPLLSSAESQNTYLGKADYNLSLWKNAVVFGANYELGSGQSPKLEFNYLAVNPGDGQYTWVDRNRDSILQVDEMEIAVFLDQANYIRVAVSTPEYIRTDNVQFSPSLRFEPRQLLLNPKKRWQKWVRRMSTQSNAQVLRRTYSNASGIQTWNPFQLEGLSDTALVTLSSGWRNTLFFNRGDPTWDFSLAQGDNRSRLAITTGFEQRQNTEWALHGRLNLGVHWSLESDAIKALKKSDNQSFSSRDFEIAAWEAGPKLLWLPSRSFRVSATTRWKNSKNALGEQESAKQLNWTAEITWNPASKTNAQGFKPNTSLRAKATIADIAFTGQANTAVAFNMLDGLQNGKNYLWSLNLDRQLSKTVQLGLNYEGRKTGENRVVHVGRAQVRALF
jgi:hypothetical protein